jgi:hypothetical protein
LKWVVGCGKKRGAHLSSLPLSPRHTPSVAPLMLMISFSRVRRWASNWAAWRCVWRERKRERGRVVKSAGRRGWPLARARRSPPHPLSLSPLSLSLSLTHLLQHELVAFVGGGHKGGGEHARGLADLSGGEREGASEREGEGERSMGGTREGARVLRAGAPPEAVRPPPPPLGSHTPTCSVMRRMRTPMVDVLRACQGPAGERGSRGRARAQACFSSSS